MRVTRRRFLAAGLGVASGAGLGYYGARVEPFGIEVVSKRLALPRLPRAFEGLRVAVLGDLHLGPYVPVDLVAHAVAIVGSLNPDLVLVLGDFVDGPSDRQFGPLREQLGRLRASLGVFAILGNHDIWTDRDAVVATVREAGLRLLLNEHVALEGGGERLHLAGIDDAWVGKPDLGDALDGVPRDAATILLAHEPDFADEAATDGRVGLQLSGHSHGGQVRLPGWGPILLPPWGQKYPAGLYRVGGMTLYTNRGVGFLKMAVRFNCPPEVTLIELWRTA